MHFIWCNREVLVLKNGFFEIHGLGDATGTVTSTGAEIKIQTSGGECIYTTSNTDVGTLTGSNITNGTAYVDVNSAPIPRTCGSFLCGSTAKWTGAYTIVAPDPLFVD